jgi:hypothetical protein
MLARKFPKRCHRRCRWLLRQHWETTVLLCQTCRKLAREAQAALDEGGEGENE